MATMAAMPTTAIRVAATPACRQIGIRMVPPCIGGDIVHTDCARDGFNPGDPKKQPPKMVRLANVHKSVHKRHENGPRRSLQGPFFAGSGDWIRICDLWVMSEPAPGSRSVSYVQVDGVPPSSLFHRVAFVRTEFTMFCSQIRVSRSSLHVVVVASAGG
jgi:hypothetical protein